MKTDDKKVVKNGNKEKGGRTVIKKENQGNERQVKSKGDTDGNVGGEKKTETKSRHRRPLKKKADPDTKWEKLFAKVLSKLKKG